MEGWVILFQSIITLWNGNSQAASIVGGPQGVTEAKEKAPKWMFNSSFSFSDIQMDHKESGISDVFNLDKITFPLKKNK